MPSGMSTLRNSGSENGSLSMPFAIHAFASAGRTDFPLNSDMTTSSCVDESGYLKSSENVDQTNPPPGTFVKAINEDEFMKLKLYF
ncbi:UNVERIFIED_CONTAM: Auxin response factor 6 [Sesamum latifolium]|uniref:Auxin response factor 6 n=1 Tax=Sesamum latifolium TaxID=2727402 RepID=A0AAW2XXE8_9LAMI